jgi:preprotein translocase subunit SecF
MIWGIFVATYSSVFICSPMLIYLGLRNEDADKAQAPSATKEPAAPKEETAAPTPALPPAPSKTPASGKKSSAKSAARSKPRTA